MMKALIVDDEDDIGFMVSKFLNKEGIESDVFNRVTDAKDRLGQEDYDLYILDISLPDGSGFDLIPKIHQQNDPYNIVMISAHDGPEEARKIDEFQVDAFIKKPFTKSDVIEVVQGFR